MRNHVDKMMRLVNKNGCVVTREGYAKEYKFHELLNTCEFNLPARTLEECPTVNSMWNFYVWGGFFNSYTSQNAKNKIKRCFPNR